jgi:hypothetical protein
LADSRRRGLPATTFRYNAHRERFDGPHILADRFTAGAEGGRDEQHSLTTVLLLNHPPFELRVASQI